LGRHASTNGSRSIHAPSVSIALSSFQEGQNARHHNQFKLEQALALQLHVPFQVCVLCGGLMRAPPSRPRQDEGWLNAPLR
jgi:hypothetical protein